MGRYIVNVSYGLNRHPGATASVIEAARSRTSACLHDPAVGAEYNAANWAKYLDTLTAAKDGKAAFVAAFTTAWGPVGAAKIGAWSTAEQDALVDLAVDLASIHGV